MDWTEGYVADIGYTFGYYPELNPLRAKLAFLNAGIVCPEVQSACELGFGQGLSINFHAAGSTATWHGTDFNPTQAANAKEIGGLIGIESNLSNDAFNDFVTKNDLPDFDYIGLHGIWSWISDENRQVITDFIAKKLKVGGVLYVSYNTLPGWASFAPMRHLLTEHAEVIGSEGRGIVSRINDSLEFATKMLATSPNFLKSNPQVSERINNLKLQNRHYLAHEYFNKDWHPMHFATMASWLKSAKLQFACSANYIDHVIAATLTPAQSDFLKEIPDPLFRESVRDFMVNQQFRKDYWVKGSRPLSALEKAELAWNHKVILLSEKADISLKLQGPAAEVKFNETIYGGIIDILSDFKPKTLGQLENELKGKGVNMAQLIEAAVVLVGMGHLSSVQDEPVISKVRKKTEKINQFLMNKARSSNEYNFLVSPVIGGGFQVDKINQLFTKSYLAGVKNTKELAKNTWELLAIQGQKIVKEGKTLELAEENLVELESMAEKFLNSKVHIMKSLQII